MLLLAADENLNDKLVRGVQRMSWQLDIVRVQDAGLRGADDPVVLRRRAMRTACCGTHDVATMARLAYERVNAGLSMPGGRVCDDEEPCGHGPARPPQTRSDLGFSSGRQLRKPRSNAALAATWEAMASLATSGRPCRTARTIRSC